MNCQNVINAIKIQVMKDKNIQKRTSSYKYKILHGI